MTKLDWRALTREAGLDFRGEAIEVRFGDERSRQVHVGQDELGTVRVWTVVARPTETEKLDNPELYVWLRNRLLDLVDFRVDSNGRLIGEASVATPGLTAAEWGLYVRTVALASERLKYLLTGRDIE